MSDLITPEQYDRWPMETRVLVDEALERGALREVTPGEVQWVLDDACRWTQGYYYETEWMFIPPRPLYVNRKVMEYLYSVKALVDEHMLLVEDPFYFEMPAPKQQREPEPDPSPKSKVPRFVRQQQARLDGRRK